MSKRMSKRMSNKTIRYIKTRIGSFAEIFVDDQYYFRYRNAMGLEITINKYIPCTTLEEFMDWCMEEQNE